ncbi:hypothetical protein [Modestobacter sp. Leaf380]|uniref:hypothetical protein n=1 Tax=Modestobacter sp. Leaf380 TaxID=1736356 RepID=UPI0012F9DF1E|nr:hypothetical protein [Modestobacter sp. Leaf380]
MLFTPMVVGVVTAPQATAAPTASSISTVAAAVEMANELLAANALAQEASLAVTYEPDELHIITQISLPAEMLEELSASFPGVSVEVDRPDYSVEELNEEAARIGSLPGISWVGPNADYSGLDVGVVEDASAAAIETDEPIVTVDSAAESLSEFPVEVIEAEVLDSANRSNDSRPVNGGSLLYNAGAQQACTAGIGVSYANGTRFGFTTAEHCAPGAWTGWGSGAAAGSSDPSAVSRANDIRVVQASTTTNLAWIGAWNSTSSRKVYRAASAPANGQAICTGGGVSGERCGAQYVRGTNMYATVDAARRGPGFWILNETVSGGAQVCAAQPGDSGGPVYNYTSDGRLDVRGLISAVDPSFSTIRCAGNPSFPALPRPKSPSSRAFAVTIAPALASVGAVPRIG